MKAAALLVILLGFHMLMMNLHFFLGLLGFNLKDVLDYSSVMERAGNPVWALYYIIFLAVALYHGLYGLRSILLETFHGKGAMVFINGLVLTIGSIAFLYGTYVVIMSYMLGGV
jgi:succinate dehydrogenase / fumarate reductase membrane anchor subunit